MNGWHGGDWLPQQLLRMESYGTPRCVDIHCHCLPGFDDGPASPADAVILCRALAEDGITTVVATPHQLGRYERENSAARIRQAIERLSALLVEEHIPLDMLAGGDIRVDERLASLLDASEIGTVADAGKYLLLELPHELFVDPTSAIEMLHSRGLQAIMTHPERYRYLHGSMARPQEWVAAGAALQVTAGSLIGAFGNRAYDHAWQLVREGLVALVATDAHDTVQRPPLLTAAIERLEQEVGHEAARTIAIDNPLRVIEGVPLLPMRKP
jgi:protein-tyrosine phosphatase